MMTTMAAIMTTIMGVLVPIMRPSPVALEEVEEEVSAVLEGALGALGDLVRQMTNLRRNPLHMTTLHTRQQFQTKVCLQMALVALRENLLM